MTRMQLKMSTCAPPLPHFKRKCKCCVAAIVGNHHFGGWFLSLERLDVEQSQPLLTCACGARNHVAALSFTLEVCL